MAVVKPEKPASALMRVALAASDPLIYLHYGSLWVATAGCLAIVIGRRAFGEVEGSPMLSAASSVVTHSVISGVLLFPFAMVLICVRIMRSVSNGTFAKKDIEEPTKTTRQIMRELLKDPFMVGTLVSMPLFMLIAAAQLVELQSPVKGSRREQIASVLKDVGIFGSAAAHCFVVLPTQILRQWRMK